MKKESLLIVNTTSAAYTQTTRVTLPLPFSPSMVKWKLKWMKSLSSYESRLKWWKGILTSHRLYIMPQLMCLTDREENDPASSNWNLRFAQINVVITWVQPEFISTCVSYSVCMTQTNTTTIVVKICGEKDYLELFTVHWSARRFMVLIEWFKKKSRPWVHFNRNIFQMSHNLPVYEYHKHYFFTTTS